MKNLILTEIVNSGKIGSVMLKSFHWHHPNHQIHIVGTQSDFEELGEIYTHPNNKFIDISLDTGLLEKYKKGHQGTAHVFANAISGVYGEFDCFTHIDGDVYFKKEIMSLIEYKFYDGFDIIGSLRCYGNNPSGVMGLERYPDTVSTYFMGIRLNKIPKYEFNYLAACCEGGAHPLGYPVLDFFDGITHAALQNGAKIFYPYVDVIGGQNTLGNKKSKYLTNMHMDCGSHLIHFGGVSSGCAFHHGKSNTGYGDWALGRYSFFAKAFYNEDIGYDKPTVYTPDGRWSNGNYDQAIMNQFKKDIEN